MRGGTRSAQGPAGPWPPTAPGEQPEAAGPSARPAHRLPRFGWTVVTGFYKSLGHSVFQLHWDYIRKTLKMFFKTSVAAFTGFSTHLFRNTAVQSCRRRGTACPRDTVCSLQTNAAAGSPPGALVLRGHYWCGLGGQGWSVRPRLIHAVSPSAAARGMKSLGEWVEPPAQRPGGVRWQSHVRVSATPGAAGLA